MKFREFETKSKKKILAGKSAANNEKLVEQIEEKETVLHTKEPGSPFVNIKGKASKKDIKEAAVFCARYSQDWRDNKGDIAVHIFKGKDIYKRKKMKLGTFGVKKFKEIKVKKKEIQNLIKKEKEK
jgi:predicted ribosome quality control (RQC) complex YloA/Tae2 family protein